jgi:hypothetical protein
LGSSARPRTVKFGLVSSMLNIDASFGLEIQVKCRLMALLAKACKKPCHSGRNAKSKPQTP